MKILEFKETAPDEKKKQNLPPYDDGFNGYLYRAADSPVSV